MTIYIDSFFILPDFEDDNDDIIFIYIDIIHNLFNIEKYKNKNKFAILQKIKKIVIDFKIFAIIHEIVMIFLFNDIKLYINKKKSDLINTNLY